MNEQNINTTKEIVNDLTKNTNITKINHKSSESNQQQQQQKSSIQTT